MGLFDVIFGSKQKTSQTTTLDQTTVAAKDLTATETQKTTQEQISSGATTQDTTQQQTTTQLDEQTQLILQDLIKQLSGDFSAAGGTVLDSNVLEAVPENLDFASFLAERAGATEGVLNTNTDAIVTEAQRQGENALEIQGTRLAMGAGSNLNSIVQAAQAQGRADLETQLAGLRGSLGIQARQAGSQDLATAFGARSEAARGGADIQIAGQTAGVQSLSQLVAALTGATTETTGVTSAVGTTEETSSLEQLVASLQEIIETSTTKSTTEQTSISEQRGRDSLISSFTNLIGALPGND